MSSAKSRFLFCCGNRHRRTDAGVRGSLHCLHQFGGCRQHGKIGQTVSVMIMRRRRWLALASSIPWCQTASLTYDFFIRWGEIGLCRRFLLDTTLARPSNALLGKYLQNTGAPSASANKEAVATRPLHHQLQVRYRPPLPSDKAGCALDSYSQLSLTWQWANMGWFLLFFAFPTAYFHEVTLPNRFARITPEGNVTYNSR